MAVQETSVGRIGAIWWPNHPELPDDQMFHLSSVTGSCIVTMIHTRERESRRQNFFMPARTPPAGPRQWRRHWTHFWRKSGKWCAPPRHPWIQSLFPWVCSFCRWRRIQPCVRETSTVCPSARRLCDHRPAFLTIKRVDFLKTKQ